MKVYHKVICGFTIILVMSGCASKFAPVVSRPDNLIIDCPTGCKFNIPMNTEIVVARNTNGYDVAKEFVKQIPFIGALALSWKSMDVAENIAESAIESFNRGRDAGASTVTNNTTSTVTGDTITTGDTISTETDSSGSGNSSSADVAETGDTITIGGDGALDGGSIERNPVTYDTTYSNSYNTLDSGYCNGSGCFAPTP